MDSSRSRSKAIIGLVVITLLVIATTAVVVTTSNKKSSVDSAATASDMPLATSQPNGSASNVPSGNFKDGTYSANATYQSPAGTESIDVTVILSDGIVKDISATPHANSWEAEEYQGKFMSGYKSKVVGKKINEVSLSRVAGSSLTSMGFNDAISDIEKQAQA